MAITSTEASKPNSTNHSQLPLVYCVALTETLAPFTCHSLRASPSLGLWDVDTSNLPVLKRRKRLVLPTPTSPTRTTLSGIDSVRLASDDGSLIFFTTCKRSDPGDNCFLRLQFGALNVSSSSYNGYVIL